MSIIRSLRKSLAFVALPASCVLAQDKPAAQTASHGVESFETVNKEYDLSRFGECEAPAERFAASGVSKSLMKESP